LQVSKKAKIMADNPVTKALDDLKVAIFQPNERLRRKYGEYSLGQLNELVEEIEGEMDRLPPFAVGKLKVLADELSELAMELNKRKEDGDVR
jgi:hypothetical protein